MIDERLLQHWQQQRTMREQARLALPPSWREDPRPEMAEVRETYVEAVTRIKGATLRLVRDDS